MNTVPNRCRAKKVAIHIGTDASRRVDTMLERQNLSRLHKTRSDVPHGTIGCLGLGSAALTPQGNICLFTGAPINGPNVDAIVDAESAARLLPEYDGAFAGMFWDAAQQVLVVVTDCLGMQPLYVRRIDDELTIVSDTKALDGEPDLAAWGAFISIGHPIGERSLMHDVKRVPPASVLRYNGVSRQLEIDRYWYWPEPSDAWRHYDFLKSLETDIRGAAAFGDPGTVLLSGGFDSRLLLYLLKRARIPVDALIIAHKDECDDADGRLAETIAKRAHVPFRKVTPPANFFSSPAYLDYVIASDAGFPSLDLFIAKVASQITAHAVWDGLVPGFTFMPLHQPEGGFDAYLRREVCGLDSPIWRAAKQVFNPDVVEAMYTGFQDDLRTEMSRVPADMYGLARFVIENRSRHRASLNPLKVYANTTDAFTPGLSKDFMTHAAMIPFHAKQQARLYRELFCRLDNKALKVPFLSGGQLMPGKRPNAAFYRERARAALWKFRTLHPSLLPVRRPTSRSVFVGPQLFAHDDPCIEPQACTRLGEVTPANYPVWKLLFHWRAWRDLHARDACAVGGAECAHLLCRP